MENTNNEQTILTANVTMETSDERCFPAKTCVNYGLVASIRGDIDAGLSLMDDQLDPELQTEIQARREELQALCAACPVSMVRDSLSMTIVEVTLSQAERIQAIRSTLGRQATSTDVLSVARRMGLNVTGGGNHPYVIEGPDGRKIPVPGHPRPLSPGVISSTRRFFANYM